MLKRNGFYDIVTGRHRSKPQVSFKENILHTSALLSREGGITGGLSSLHLAVMYNNIEILRMLIEDKRIDTSQTYSGMIYNGRKNTPTISTFFYRSDSSWNGPVFWNSKPRDHWSSQVSGMKQWFLNVYYWLSRYPFLFYEDFFKCIELRIVCFVLTIVCNLFSYLNILTLIFEILPCSVSHLCWHRNARKPFQFVSYPGS